eukprot:GHVR01108149.1.p1 GENE.GHVR01108149.1~~GHVR01108149.1.p1  ORF type:complete len:1421 (-),score=238.78 GHVR01108149.1:459-4649(-)
MSKSIYTITTISVFIFCVNLAPIASYMMILAPFNFKDCHGMQWSDVLSTGELIEVPLMVPLIGMMGGTVLWYFIAAYIEQVGSHEHGDKKNLCYCNKRGENQQRRMILAETTPLMDEKLVIEPLSAREKSLQSLDKSVELVNITKVYPTTTGPIKAVDSVNLSMFPGEIFVLLGHNGSGKSTSLSILTGHITPTVGHVKVFGYTTKDKKSRGTRPSIGVCTQNDILWNDLTVQQHLRLYASFGSSEVDAEDSIKSIYENDATLKEKADRRVRDLSGGVQRRLTIALAFIGNPKCVVLDEPTGSIDPYYKRELWKIIQSYKRDRVVILTTHCMSEAEYIGDRVGVMYNGRVVAYGSSNYLKLKYNCKCIINVSLTDTSFSDHVTQNIKNICRDTQICESKEKEIKYHIPVQFKHMNSSIIRSLESLTEEVESFSISTSTLDEVFLKVASGIQFNEKIKDYYNMNDNNNNNNSTIDFRTSQGISSFNSMFYLNYYFVKKTRSIILFYTLLFCMLICYHFIPSIHKEESKHREMNISNNDAIPLNGERVLSYGNMFDITQGDKINTVDINYYAPCLRSNLFEFGYGKVVDVPTTCQCNDISKEEKATLKNESYPKKLFPFIRNLHKRRYESNESRYSAYRFFEANVVSSLPPTINNLDKDWLGLQVDAYIYSNATLVYGPLKYHAEWMGTIRKSIGFDHISSVTVNVVNNRESVFYTNRARAVVVITILFMSCIYYSLRDFDTYEKDLFNKRMVTSGISTGSVANTLAHLVLFNLIFIPLTICAFFVLAIIESKFFCKEFFFLITSAVLVLTVYCKGTGPFVTHLTSSQVNFLCVIYFPLFYAFIDTVTPGIPLFSVGAGLYRYIYLTLSRHTLSQARVKHLCDLHVHQLYFNLILIVAWKIFKSIQFKKIFFKIFCDKCCVYRVDGRIKDGDASVHEERRRVLNSDPTSISKDSLNVMEIQMTFGPPQFFKFSPSPIVAVSNVTFSVSPGEIVALLGVNGAGKTTTMNMMMGIDDPVKGRVYMCGLPIKNNKKRCKEMIGVCPQEDCLINNFTVKEHLNIFITGKGIKNKNVAMSQYLDYYGLKEHANTPAGHLSGGYRRRLSLAMAAVGTPQILFLDEPTCGLDPCARKSFWDIIRGLMSVRSNISTVEAQQRPAVVFTTHSMEEAESLATRVIIMTRGELKCIGSPQQLKDAYSNGVEFSVIPKPKSLEDIDRFIKDVLKLSGDTTMTVSLASDMLQVAVTSLISDLKADNPDTIVNKLFIRATGDKTTSIGAIDMTDDEKIEMIMSHGMALLFNNKSNNECELQDGITVKDFGEWILGELSAERLINLMSSQLNATLVGRDSYTLKFTVDPSTKISTVFSSLESISDELSDYSVNQSSLENVFLNIAEQCRIQKA